MHLLWLLMSGYITGGSLLVSFTNNLTGNFLRSVTIVDTFIQSDNARQAINEYFPDSIPLLQFNGKPFTLVHLLNQSSGLLKLPMNIFRNFNSSYPFSHYYKEALCYNLKSFELSRVLLEYIITPLQINHTRQHTNTEHIVPGFNAFGNPMPLWNFLKLCAAGCIRSSIADLMLFSEAQLPPPSNSSGKAIKLAQQSSFKQRDIEVAMGWHVLTIRENQYLVHEGQTRGYSSIIVFNRATQNAVIILVWHSITGKTCPANDSLA